MRTGLLCGRSRSCVVLLLALQAPGLAQGLGWSQLAVPGPGQRHSHALAYDAARGVVVLFGGLDGGRTNGQLLGDTWEWNGNAWTQVATTGPSARLGAAMVHDARRGVVLLFGGSDGTFRDDTWEWDGARWRQVASGGPRARSRHALAYDAARGVTVLFGALPVRGTETWEWDGTRWQQVATAGPSERSRTAMAFDAVRGRTVLFGGLDAANRPLGDTWTWDGTTWTQLAPNPAPPARSRHALVFDDAAGVCRLFSGLAGPLLRDTWEWDGSAWRQVASGGVPPRMYHAMVHQKARGTSLVFGGWDLSAPLADTWEYVAAPPCATPVAFGCETPHCAGAPRLSAATCARVGNAAFALEVANAVPDQPPPAGGLLFLSATAAPGQALPCSSAVAQRVCFNVAPDGVGFTVAIDARGRGRLPLPIPGDAALVGQTVFGQFLGAHPARDCPCLLAPGAGFSGAKGLAVRLQ
jgi:hypothetical protein